MAISPIPKSESDFVCECEKWMRTACAEEPFYNEHEGKRYCVLHFPGKEKSADFNKALQHKIDNKDFDFQGVWFPEVSFCEFIFSAAANFSSATFNEWASFNRARFDAKVNFVRATFRWEVGFSYATFGAEVQFNGVTFGKPAYFEGTTFNKRVEFSRATFTDMTYFQSAIFSAEAYFDRATFKTVIAYFSGAIFSTLVSFDHAIFFGRPDFREVSFGDYAKFAGTEFKQTSSVDFQFAKIEKPDHFSFHTITLRPHWFVNVDARKFEFTNVQWDAEIKPEIQDLACGEYNLTASPHRLLAIACRNLAVNAEENHRYEDASKLRYLAMEARRLEGANGFVPWRLSWWYWLASGYGERVFRAFLVLISVWFVAGLLYTRVGFARWEPRLVSESEVATASRDVVGAPLQFSRALTYSAAVMTFQRPEPRPATIAAQTIVLLETILGPVQAALLALAIRRKFMR